MRSFFNIVRSFPINGDDRILKKVSPWRAIAPWRWILLCGGARGGRSRGSEAYR
jgi:hypothetical protein